MDYGEDLHFGAIRPRLPGELDECRVTVRRTVDGE
jgi:hypothetical protein